MFRNIVRSALLVLCLEALNCDLYGYTDGDFQIWHTEVQDVNLKEGTKLLAEEEFRYGDSAGELYYHHYDLGLAYDVNKYLTTSINYRQIYEGEKGKFKPEYYPYLNITPKYELYGFKLEDRNRFALKLFDDKREDSVQYRNRLLIKAPWKFTPLGIQPYVSNEVFVKLNNAAWDKNRFAAGVSLDFLKNLKGDIYYMLQSTKKSGRWTDANILGLKLKLIF
ncbi:MAG: DUF2490 domain-containing protein [Candidatus Omnitrophota bacterium]